MDDLDNFKESDENEAYESSPVDPFKQCFPDELKLAH